MSNHSQSHNFSTRPSSAFKANRSGHTLTMTATLLCCFAVFPLSRNCFAQPQITSNEATLDHPGWAQIPGELIRADCVHEIPNGARVEVDNDGQISGDVTLNGRLLAHYDRCSEDPVVTRPRGRTENLANSPGTGNGWVEASQWDVPLSSTDNLDYMAGIWTVPSNPSSNGALIYLFNGIEPLERSWVLQPVLQYGRSNAGGGNYWAIASWLVSSNGYAFHSPLGTVRPGDSIFGYTRMTTTSGSTQYWGVVADDTTTGLSAWITASSSGLHWTWAFAAVLEAYNVTSCTQFPSNGRAVFSNSVVDHGFPSYTGISPQGWYQAVYSYGGPSCGFSVVPGNESILNF
jgi:hypothetical protein